MGNTEKNALNAMVEVARLASSTQQALSLLVEAGVEGRVMVDIRQGREGQEVYIRANERTQRQIVPLFDVTRTDWYGRNIGDPDDFFGGQRNIMWTFNGVDFYMCEGEGELRRLAEQDERDRMIEEEMGC